MIRFGVFAVLLMIFAIPDGYAQSSAAEGKVDCTALNITLNLEAKKTCFKFPECHFQTIVLKEYVLNGNLFYYKQSAECEKNMTSIIKFPPSTGIRNYRGIAIRELDADNTCFIIKGPIGEGALMALLCGDSDKPTEAQMDSVIDALSYKKS